MSTIIGIASVKGGVGKSTIAANAVGWLTAFGYETILVDCDEPTNRTSSNWLSEALPQVPVRIISDANELWDELPRLRGEAEYVVVDTPGTSEMIRQVFMRADIAVIPTKAGKAEADPLVASVRLLRQAQEIRNGKPRAHVVLTQVGKRFSQHACDGLSWLKNCECHSLKTHSISHRDIRMLVTTPHSSGTCRMQSSLRLNWMPCSMRYCLRHGRKKLANA